MVAEGLEQGGTKLIRTKVSTFQIIQYVADILEADR